MDIRPLSPEILEVAIKDLNEDPTRREQDLKHIRDWLAKQPHLRARTGKLQYLCCHLHSPPPPKHPKRIMELLTLSEKFLSEMEFEPWSPALHACALPLVI